MAGRPHPLHHYVLDYISFCLIGWEIQLFGALLQESNSLLYPLKSDTSSPFLSSVLHSQLVQAVPAEGVSEDFTFCPSRHTRREGCQSPWVLRLPLCANKYKRWMSTLLWGIADSKCWGYPRNIPQGRRYGGATFSSTNHHVVAHLVFVGLEWENNVREKLQVSKFFLPALFFFIIAGDVLLKLSWYCYESRAGKQSTPCQELLSFAEAHPQGTTSRTPLPAISLPKAGCANKVNCPPSPSERRLANIIN